MPGQQVWGPLLHDNNSGGISNQPQCRGLWLEALLVLSLLHNSNAWIQYPEVLQVQGSPLGLSKAQVRV
jgi:hypothetical protein